VNQVKLQIGIFGGKFEVDMDNSALFRANVLTWHFEILSGKAAFKMSARFKNDIPKDLIHTISDTADDILARVDSISSIFTKHIQNFIDKLKNYLPLDAKAFLKFILDAAEFLKRSIQATKFGKSFSQIVKGFKNALRANGLWRKIAVLVAKLLRNLKGLSLSDAPFREAFQFLTELVDLISRTAFDLPQGFPGNFNIKEFLEHISRKYDSIGEAVADYFKKLGVSVPGNFFGMLHFKITLRFSVSLEKFRTVTIRLTDFGNNFLEMLSVFREIIRIELPRIHLPGFGLTTGGNSPFDFELFFDWRSRFNFKIDFSGPDFTKLNNFFRYLSKIFQQLDGPNIDLEKFFQEFLPILRKEMSFKDQALLGNSTSLKIELWFRELMKEFGNILKSQNGKFLDFSDTAQFLQALENQAGKFSKKSLKKVCHLQEFMLKSSGKLQEFGENLEKETIVAIKKIEDEAQTVIEEIVNVTVYVERLKDNLQKNISETAKKFVNQFLTRLEMSLQDVKELADNVAEFTNNSTDKLGGFCHKTADVSGEILDQIQAEAESAVKELAEFITTNSQGITSLVNRFKTVVTNVENWQKKNLQKRLGKFARVAETLEEFLSLLKNDNKFLKSVHTVSTNVNDVLKHLNNLPEHAEKARQAADKVIDFATNAKRWETEVKKLNIRKKFKLDFDDQLRKLCNEFQVLAQDSVKKIQGDNLFKTFREFVTKETDALISRGVGKLDLLKEPLERVRSELGKVSESVREVEDVLIEMKPFSKNFSPVLKEVNQLPNCTQIGFILDDITKKCGKSGKAFSKQAYGEYQDLRSEVKAFVELLPDEWESLGLRKCVEGGTCLSEAFIKQGQGVAKKIKTLKRKFENKELFESLAPCKDAVEAFSVVVQKVKNISVSVEAFSLKDDVLKIKDLARRITGRFSGESDGQVCILLYSSLYLISNCR
jgi:ABC-type transporter Mla subunit MlaD